MLEVFKHVTLFGRQLRLHDRGEFGFIFEEWNSLSVYTTEMFLLHISTHYKKKCNNVLNISKVQR